MTNHPNRSKYAIRVEPHYYAGDLWGRHRPHLVYGYLGDDQLIVLGNRSDADAVARMLNDDGPGPYFLAHNQYAAPSYTVVRYRGAAPALTLNEAMILCGLNEDFRPDGSRIAFHHEI
jgi:hypothetical protein